MADRIDRPNFSQGWGMAGFITALAIGAFVLAGTIKNRTYRSPNDTLAPSRGAPASQAPATPGAEAKH